MIVAGAVTTPIITENAVTTTKINDGAVTFAKLQNITTNRLLGSTSSDGSVDEVKVNTNMIAVGAVDLNSTIVSNSLNIENGGTGATTSISALSNLGISAGTPSNSGPISTGLIKFDADYLYVKVPNSAYDTDNSLPQYIWKKVALSAL